MAWTVKLFCFAKFEFVLIIILWEWRECGHTAMAIMQRSERNFQESFWFPRPWVSGIKLGSLALGSEDLHPLLCVKSGA